MRVIELTEMDLSETREIDKRSIGKENSTTTQIGRAVLHTQVKEDGTRIAFLMADKKGPGSFKGISIKTSGSPTVLLGDDSIRISFSENDSLVLKSAIGDKTVSLRNVQESA